MKIEKKNTRTKLGFLALLLFSLTYLNAAPGLVFCEVFDIANTSDHGDIVRIKNPDGQWIAYESVDRLSSSLLALDKRGSFNTRLVISNVLDREVVFKKRNLLSPGYQATARTEHGIERLGLPDTHNYVVYDEADGAHLGRINFNGSTLNGMLFLPEGTYTISQQVEKDLGTIKKSNASHSNLLKKMMKSAWSQGSGHARFSGAPQQNRASKSAFAACYVIEVATESDYELYLKYGSSALQTLERVIDQFNLAEGIYLNSGIDLSFAIVYQNVWTSSSDPYIATERFDMRDEFKAVWNNAANGFSDIARDVSYMVSGKINTSGGAAFLSTAGDPEEAYAVGQEFDSDTDQHLIAHEIGHTLSASHDTGTDCVPGNKPMSGTMCTFVGTQGFSSTSVSEITTYVTDNESSFTEPSNLVVLGFLPITGISNYVATATINLNVVVNSTGYLQAVAGESITLPPGFHGKRGAHVRVAINPDMDSCN